MWNAIRKRMEMYCTYIIVRVVSDSCLTHLKFMEKMCYHKAGNTSEHKVRQIGLCVLVYMAQHATANSLGLPHALCGPIHWLLIHQSFKAQPKMPTIGYTCIRVQFTLIHDTIFDIVKQSVAYRSRFGLYSDVILV